MFNYIFQLLIMIPFPQEGWLQLRGSQLQGPSWGSWRCRPSSESPCAPAFWWTCGTGGVAPLPPGRGTRCHVGCDWQRFWSKDLYHRKMEEIGRTDQSMDSYRSLFLLIWQSTMNSKMCGILLVMVFGETPACLLPNICIYVHRNIRICIYTHVYMHFDKIYVYLHFKNIRENYRHSYNVRGGSFLRFEEAFTTVMCQLSLLH